MNTVMLVGRLAQNPEARKTESGKDVVRISVAVNRSFKNPNGIYETDFIDCTLWDGLAKNINEYCKKGDTVGIRGRLQVSHYEKEELKLKRVDVIVEKLTFLGSSKNNKDKELENADSVLETENFEKKSKGKSKDKV